MSAAVDTSIRRPGALTAELVCGRRYDARPLSVRASRLGRRAVTVSTELPLGAFAWLNVTLPSGVAIRPLVQATSIAEGGTACRIVHVFPDDHRALDAYNADQASPSGY